MTPRRGEAGRGPGASGGEAPAPSGAALLTLLIAALVVRWIIAYVLFPHSGFMVDIGDFDSWGDTLMQYGPGGFYTHAGFSDYTPGYLYVLWAYRNVAEWFGSNLFQVPALASDVKLPAMVFDLALGVLIYRAVRSWAGWRAGLVGAALYLFNPVTIYESSLWGQVDAVGAFVLVAAILLLIAGWSEAATGAAMFATLVKPQYGIVLLAVGFVLLGRHLVFPGRGVQPVPRHPLAVRINDALGGWFTNEQGSWRLVSSAAVGLIVLFAVITPFDLAEYAAQQAPRLGALAPPIGGDLGGLLIVVGQAVGQYHYLTVNAHNLWALVGPTPLAWTGLWTNDLQAAIAGIPYYLIGVIVLVTAITVLAHQYVIRDDRRSILITTTVLAVAVFVIPTRVHERYLFPAFALGALLAATSTRWRWWYVGLALVNVANLHANLTNPLYGTPNVTALALGDTFRTGNVIAFVAIAHTALFGWAFLHVRPALDEILAFLPGRGRQPAGVPMVWRTPWTPPPPPALAAATRAPDRALPVQPDLAPAVVRAEATAPPGAGDRPIRTPGPPAEPSWSELGIGTTRIWGAVRSRLALPSIRPDRSVLLRAESGGRLDRLDALALVLILVVGMALRGVRADQPVQMVTLDELYHPRTAAEFLQDWRYGIPHSIYEYTHPHLAKYFMALGIVAFGDNRVVSTSDLGAPVRSVALEQRYQSFDHPSSRSGERLFVATAGAVRVIDLRSGADEARLPVVASAVAVDDSTHTVYAASQSGVIWSLDTATLDRWRDVGGDMQDFAPVQVARVDGPVDRIWPLGEDGLAVASGDGLIAVDTRTGDVLATREKAGVRAAIAGDAVSTLVAHPDAITAIGATASTIADLMGLQPSTVEAQLTSSGGDSPAGVRLASYLTADQRTSLQQAIDDGKLTGVEVVDRRALIAGMANGLAVLDGTSLDTISEVPLDAGASGLDLVGEGSDRRLYVAMDDERVQVVRLATDAAPTRSDRLPMPGPVTDVRWNKATNLVHVLGQTPTGQPTVYVVEPHGNSVFADARLPFTPVAWVLDVEADYASSDREMGLTFAADGRTAAIDVGNNAFGWRIPGIVLGVLMAGAMYLLARILFRRRSVALLTAAAALADGMLFAHSRDAMNDAYVGFFIVAAAVVLAWLWMPGPARRGSLSIALGLPIVGVLLGLALASKWAGAFAIGAAVLIVLMRSAVGRVVALAGLVILAGLLGNLAMATGNLTFGLLMLGIALAVAAAMAWHPMAFSREELRFVGVGPAAVGAVLLVIAASGRLDLGTVRVAGATVPLLLSAGVLFLMLAVAAWVGVRLAAGIGWLPVSRANVPADAVRSADDDEPSPPPPRGWLRPGTAAGLPLAYGLVCLVAIPLLVYVLSYVPWARPWDPNCATAVNDCPQILPATLSADGTTTLSEGWPPLHRGQTLYNLTVGMYNYHNDLRATHPASSPWWAWPLDLKPVWLFQDPHGAGTTAVIFDAGNLVLFWLSVPAIAFGLWQAWRRRSLALAFIGVFFLAQWLSWARIDRATFQYHYYTAIPFAFLFLAYFLAELWHGPSRRTWMLARVAAAIGILGPGLLWLVKDPLCTAAGVSSVAPSSYLCTTASGTFAVPLSLIATIATLIVGLAVVTRELLEMRRPTAPLAGGGDGPPDRRTLLAGMPGWTLARLIVVALAVGLAVTLAPRIVGSGSISLSASIGQAWLLAVAYVLGAAAFAWLALGARDPRKAVVLILGAAVAWFALFYPYIADLPLPSGLVFVYQRLLPTWDYSFQFAVNRAPSPKVGLLDQQGLVLVASIGLATFVAWLLVRQWRLDRRAYEAELEGDGRQPAGS